MYQVFDIGIRVYTERHDQNGFHPRGDGDDDHRRHMSNECFREKQDKRDNENQDAQHF